MGRTHTWDFRCYGYIQHRPRSMCLQRQFHSSALSVARTQCQTDTKSEQAGCHLSAVHTVRNDYDLAAVLDGSLHVRA